MTKAAIYSIATAILAYSVIAGLPTTSSSHAATFYRYDGSSLGPTEKANQQPYDENVETTATPLKKGSPFSQQKQRLTPLIKQLAKKHRIDAALLKAIIHTESGFNPMAVSSKGAMGLMQLMPFTALRFDVDDPFDEEENINAGAQYVSWLLKRFKNDVILAIAAYNSGEATVDKYRGIPPYPETQAYVKKVMRLRATYKN